MLIRFALLFFCATGAGACDVCDGLATRKVASGEVLEISDEGLERLAPAHPLLVLLLYKPHDSRTRQMQEAIDAIAASLKALGLLTSCVMAQLDADACPRAAAMLHVEPTEMPAIRIVRGDPSFGYALRASGGTVQDLASHVRAEVERTAAPPLTHLDAPDMAAFEAAADGGTRVIAAVHLPHSRRAIEQAAHALHGVVAFALPHAAPATPPGPAHATASAPTPQPPSAPPPPIASPAPSSAPPAIAKLIAPERVRLIRESSDDFAGEPPTLEMPARFPAVAGEAPSLAAPPAASPRSSAANAVTNHRMTEQDDGEREESGGGWSARQVHRWVRWAALPSVYALTPQTAATYLVDGASGVLFVPGAAPSGQTRDYATRRLRKVSRQLIEAGDHGLWLLYAGRHDPVHVRLRTQLGLATSGGGGGIDGGGGAGGGGRGGAAAGESDFAIVVMASGRIAHRFVMPPPFTYERVHAHCRAFVRGELLAAQRRWDTLYLVVTALAAVVLALGSYPAWRRLARWWYGSADATDAVNQAATKPKPMAGPGTIPRRPAKAKDE